jgi:hypothetical protein
MPPQLACHFTTSELSVLRVVADEVRHRGFCDRSIPEIAARAGTCTTTVRNALREARLLGLVSVRERRLSYSPQPAEHRDHHPQRVADLAPAH